MTPKAIYDFLRTVEPFNLLNDQVLEDISSKVTIKKYSSSQFIFKQGQPSLGCLLIIVSGLVELLVTSERGAESVVGYRKPGDFFSETVVLSSQNYPGSARAKEPLKCIQVKRALLEDLIRQYSEFSGYFSALLAERMRLLYENIQTKQNETLAGVSDLPLFQKKVGEIMSSPVNCCGMNDQVSQASMVMAQKGISSTVVIDKDGKPRGILTEKDIVYHLVTCQTYPVDNCTAGQIMTTDYSHVAPDEFVGQALVALTRHRIKYLLVMEKEKLTGILTAMDLIKSRHIGNLTLLQDIRDHKTIKELARISQEVDGVLNALLMEGAKVKEIFQVMSELLERFTRAVIRLAEQEMEIMGHGLPPVEYCWINMGSAARHEQTLRTDQDNGIIYADPDPGNKAAVENYFKILSKIIVNGLDECGFALCPGDVMATNPKWCKSVSGWYQNIEKWTGSFNSEDTRSMTIFLDFRPVWGNQALANLVWEKIFNVLGNSEVTSHMLTSDDLKHEKPVGFLGHIRTEKSGPHKNQFSLKTGGLVHLINGIRIYAINNGITEPSTLGRLKLLTQKGIFSKDTSDLLQTGFETLIMFKITTNVQNIASGQLADNYIFPAKLSKMQRRLLKDALLSVTQIQKLINSDFNAAWINFFS